MSVSNGQKGNQTILNNAFLSKTANNTAAGDQTFTGNVAIGTIADVEAELIDHDDRITVVEALVNPSVTGTRSVPSSIVAGSGIAFTGTAWFNIWFVQGSGGAVDISADPQIAAGSNVGQRLILIGCDDTNTVKLENGTGVKLSGGSAEVYLFADTTIEFIWNGTNWSQI
jgi:hypothetical protein